MALINKLIPQKDGLKRKITLVDDEIKTFSKRIELENIHTSQADETHVNHAEHPDENDYKSFTDMLTSLDYVHSDVFPTINIDDLDFDFEKKGTNENCAVDLNEIIRNNKTRNVEIHPYAKTNDFHGLDFEKQTVIKEKSANVAEDIIINQDKVISRNNFPMCCPVPNCKVTKPITSAWYMDRHWEDNHTKVLHIYQCVACYHYEKTYGNVEKKRRHGVFKKSKGLLAHFREVHACYIEKTANIPIDWFMTEEVAKANVVTPAGYTYSPTTSERIECSTSPRDVDCIKSRIRQHALQIPFPFHTDVPKWMQLLSGIFTQEKEYQDGIFLS